MELSDKELYYVFKHADKLNPGEIIVISERAPNKPDIYIDGLKRWINVYKHGEFNSDYTVFKKLSDPDDNFLDPKIKPNWLGMMKKIIFNE